MANRNWIVWNKESKSIEDIGTEIQMRDKARKMNGWYQTDAYVAKEYIYAE